MKVKPMLGDWEIPRIESIRILERRGFAELPVPGREGSLFHDLDADPAAIAVSGSLYGDELRSEFLETVREKFRAGEPLTFVADITTATSVQHVLVERFYVEEEGGRPDEIRYHLTLRQSPPPPPEEDPLGALDDGLLDDAAGLADSLTSAMDVIETLGSVPDLGDPTAPLRDSLDDVRAATEGLDGVVRGLGEALGGGDE